MAREFLPPELIKDIEMKESSQMVPKKTEASAGREPASLGITSFPNLAAPSEEYLASLSPEDQNKYVDTYFLENDFKSSWDKKEFESLSDAQKENILNSINSGRLPEALQIEQAHPALGWKERMAIMGLGDESDPKLQEFIEKIHPDINFFQSEGRIFAKKGDEKYWRPLDPSPFTEELSPNVNTAIEIAKDFGKDVVELIPDAISGLADYMGAAGGFLAGAPGGPLTATGGALAGIALMAGFTDAAKQITLNKLLAGEGIDRPFNMTEMMLNGTAAPILTAVFGAQLAPRIINKYASKQADKVLRKTLPSYEKVLENPNLLTSKERTKFLDTWKLAKDTKEAAKLNLQEKTDELAEDMSQSIFNKGIVPSIWEGIFKKTPSKIAEFLTPDIPARSYMRYIRNLDDMERIKYYGAAEASNIADDLKEIVEDRVSYFGKVYEKEFEEETKKGKILDLRPVMRELLDMKHKASSNVIQNRYYMDDQNKIDEVFANLFYQYDPVTKKPVSSFIPYSKGQGGYLLNQFVNTNVTPMQALELKKKVAKASHWGIDTRKIDNIEERKLIESSREAYKKLVDIIDTNMSGTNQKKLRNAYDRNLNFSFALDDIFKRDEAKQGRFTFDQKAFSILNESDKGNQISLLENVYKLDKMYKLKKKDMFSEKIQNLKAFHDVEKGIASEKQISTRGTHLVGSSSTAGSTEGEIRQMNLLGRLAAVAGINPETLLQGLKTGKRIENFANDIIRTVHLRGKQGGPSQTAMIQSAYSDYVQEVLSNMMNGGKGVKDTSIVGPITDENFLIQGSDQVDENQNYLQQSNY